MLELNDRPILSDFQKYVSKMEDERGFSDESTIQKCLLLGEEVGELFKAVRKSENIKIDRNSDIGTIENELADVLIYLLVIANRYNIDLEKAFRDKEEINKNRNWGLKGIKQI
ncbi:pyrophosphohydrolase [Patescibacteria group bacterium]|nr:pyrophosphohydrolase [Patescibacteria group bacterium]MBU2229423.1 pyrophosphohydrolase [Patescibacteria group bacterium]